jgi:hypothetical protein
MFFFYSELAFEHAARGRTRDELRQRDRDPDQDSGSSAANGFRARAGFREPFGMPLLPARAAAFSGA